MTTARVRVMHGKIISSYRFAVDNYRSYQRAANLHKPNKTQIQIDPAVAPFFFFFFLKSLNFFRKNLFPSWCNDSDT